MSGLVGFFDTRYERKPERELLARMSGKPDRPGPDSAGYFVDHYVAMGFRRLSISDAETCDQPIYNEDGSLVLMCDGEIFNYLELKQVLIRMGHTFRTKSDVEVLLHLYEEDDFDFLNKLNGKFAFAIYDRKNRRLFLARDQFGVNPLYYANVNGLFIFASEIEAVREHPLIERASDLTTFEGIQSLENGNYIVVQNGEVSVREYWALEPQLQVQKVTA